MSAITKTRYVRPYDVMEWERGYTEPTRERYQALVEVIRLWGIPIWRRVIDREHVPGHVVIEHGATGMTFWRSKFAEHIAP